LVQKENKAITKLPKAFITSIVSTHPAISIYHSVSITQIRAIKFLVINILEAISSFMATVSPLAAFL
jgi:hypothetical protein